MSRISTEALDELIEHQGELKHGPLNSVGVLRLALDLKEARATIVALREERDAITERVRALKTKLDSVPIEEMPDDCWF